MTDLNPAALDAAVLAYDARRCEAHGGDTRRAVFQANGGFRDA